MGEYFILHDGGDNLGGFIGVNRNRRNQGSRILVGTAILGLSFAGLYTVQGLWLDSGSARLLSIEETGDSCYRPVAAESPSENLFSAFQEPTVYAQDSNSEELNRAAVRELVDTAPIFSSVGVDNVRNEVYLQDSNLWSIRVFGRTDNAKPGDPPNEPRRIISGDTSENPI